MSDVSLSLVDTAASTTLARELFVEYAKAIGTDLEYQGFAKELASLPGPYASPHGALFIASVGGAAAGCVALKRIDDVSGEVKRLYVRPAFRGHRLGERLLEASIEAARIAGYAELRLDTLEHMASAQALYRRLGFSETPPYNAAHLPGTRFFRLALEKTKHDAHELGDDD